MLFCRIDSPGEEERSIIRRSDAPGARGAEQNDETIAVRSLSHIQTFYCREVSDVDAASNTIQFLKYSSLALVDGRTRLRHHPTHERSCQEAPPRVWRRREHFRRLGKGCIGTPAPTVRSMVPTSTRAHEHTSTRAHEHTSTRAHDTQPIPPQINLTIHGSTSPAAAQKYVTNTHQDAPPTRAAPQKTPTVGSIIHAARTEARHTRHAAPQKTPHHEPARPNRRPLHPKNPMSPRFHRGRLHFEQAHGRFRTIDPSTGTRRWPFRPSTRGVLQP